MLTIKAYAKINLTLDVLGKRSDGYHDVETIMQSISLYDTLCCEPAETLTLRVEGDAPENGENLVMRAALALQKYSGITRGANLCLVKRIPAAAGLGGGSADAAAALIALNNIWGLYLPEDILMDISAGLGADVPFCIKGGTCLGQGIGTRLSPLPPMPQAYIALCKPCEGMSTKEAFSLLDAKALCGTQRPNTQGAVRALYDGDLEALSMCAGNVLETVTFPARPEARKAVENFSLKGALLSRMSGSGPSVFGIFLSEKEARNALPDEGFGAVVRPVKTGIIID